MQSTVYYSQPNSSMLEYNAGRFLTLHIHTSYAHSGDCRSCRKADASSSRKRYSEPVTLVNGTYLCKSDALRQVAPRCDKMNLFLGLQCSSLFIKSNLQTTMGTQPSAGVPASTYHVHVEFLRGNSSANVE